MQGLHPPSRTSEEPECDAPAKAVCVLGHQHAILGGWLPRTQAPVLGPESLILGLPPSGPEGSCQHAIPSLAPRPSRGHRALLT